jgi:hypothetical protein
MKCMAVRVQEGASRGVADCIGGENRARKCIRLLKEYQMNQAGVKGKMREAIAKLGVDWVVPGRKARVYPTIIPLFQYVG